MTHRLSTADRAAYDAVPVAIIITDTHDHTVVWTNHAANRLFGHTTESFHGLGIDDITHPTFRSELPSNYAVTKGEYGLVTFKRYLRRDGSSFLGELHAVVNRFDQSLTLAVITNVEDSERLRVELNRSAQTDALTGLLRREAFWVAADLVVGTGEPYVALFVDLDDFKDVNDDYGHAAGDQVLRRIGARIRASFREDDLACRFGGDEFVVLMSGVSDTTIVSQMVRALLTNIQEPVEVGDQRAIICPKVSVGVAMAEGHCPLGTAIDEADQAMYKIKRQPREIREQKPVAAVRLTRDADRHYVEGICTLQLPGIFVSRPRKPVDQPANL